MKEQLFLETIKSAIGDKYIGDDCAYLEDLGIVVSQDSLVEDIHFKTEYMTPYQLGFKSMMVNLSDISASGAEPKYVSIALSLPKTIENDFIKEFYEGAKEEDFVKAFFDEGRVFGDELAYTMPFLKSTEALFYNKTFFDEHKLTVPTTWEEMWDVCAQIKAIDPASTPLGYDSEANLFITLAETYGYGYTSYQSFDFNNDGMKSLMKTFKENYDKGYFTTQTLYGAYTNSLMTDVSAPSRAYMCIGSTAGATYQVNSDGAFETGVTSVPKAANGAAKSMSQGPSLVLLKNDNAQSVLATWLFMQFLETPSVQARFALITGYLPVTNPATEIQQYKDFLDKAAGNTAGIAALSTKQALAQRDNYFTSATFVGSSTARDEVASLIVKIMSDKSGNIEAAINSYFDAAIKECKYQSGL